MPYRASKHLGAGELYSYVTNRGYDDALLFRSPQDFTRFTDILKRLARRTPEVNVVAFAVLSSSFHLVLHAQNQAVIGKFMHRLSISYGIYFNGRYEKTGKVFAGPYKDVTLRGEDELVQVITRVHLLPLLERQASEEYLWSSYRYYLAQRGDWIDKTIVEHFFKTPAYAKELRHLTDRTTAPEDLRSLAKST